MLKVVVVVNRFPERELEIHRLSARDPAFKTACEDYSDALAAFRHWQAKGPAGSERAKEYREIVGELEAEILDLLDKSKRSAERIWPT